MIVIDLGGFKKRLKKKQKQKQKQAVDCYQTLITKILLTTTVLDHLETSTIHHLNKTNLNFLISNRRNISFTYLIMIN